MRIATIIFLIFALVNICTDFVKADFKDCVQERLLKVLQRVSGPDTNQRITISAPKSVHQLTREQSEVLTPTLSAEGPNGKKLEFRIVGLKEFEKIANIVLMEKDGTEWSEALFLLFKCLQKNHKEITLQEVESLVTIKDLKNVLEIINPSNIEGESVKKE